MDSLQETSQKALDKLCEKLRKNSKTVKNVHLHGYWSDYLPTQAAQLGPALLNSSAVSEFKIDLTFVKSDDHIKPLLPFLRTNQPLRKLALSIFNVVGASVVGAAMLGLVLDAVSENEGIEELYLEASEPIESILKCIQGTKPRVLTLRRSFVASSMDRIWDALKVNTNLHSLTLIKADNVQFLLQHLVSSSQSRPPLEILTIGSSDWTEGQVNGSTLATALAPFVASTTTLRQLKLYKFRAKTSIEPLVDAFKANQSLTDLVLHGFLSEVAGRELSTFLSSSDASTNGIRGLELGTHCLERMKVEGCLLSSLLGPSLQSLKLGSTMNMGRTCSAALLLSHLLQTGTIDRLPCRLHVPYLRFAVLSALTVLLPRVVGLAELTLSFQRRQVRRRDPMPVLLPALRQNWCLTRVSLVVENGEPYYKKETDETKKMQAYCTRNAVAPALLTGGSLQGDTTDASINEPVRRRIVPSVYVLMARHESQSTRNSIFKGVFAMEAEVENDDRPAKRARLD